MAARFDHTSLVGKALFRLKIAAAMLFMLFWLLAMTSAMAGKGCSHPAKPDATRLRLCNTAIAVGGFLMWIEPHKSGQLYMTRGIRKANLGQTDAAIADMRRAVDMVTGGKPDMILPFVKPASGGRSDLRTIHGADHWPATLVAQTLRPDTSPAAKEAWAEVVAEIAAGS